MAKTEPQPNPADAIVDKWFNATFHGLGPDISTPVFNKLYAAKQTLKDALASIQPPPAS